GLFTDVVEPIGFGGAMPDRLYALADSLEPVGPGQRPQVSGRSVFRSDDEGRTWTQILSTAQPGEEEREPSMTALTYVPDDAHWVYVSMGTSLLASNDAGRTWFPMGRTELPRISALALDATRAYLYAATEAGIYRLR